MMGALLAMVRPCVLGLVALLLSTTVADASPEWSPPVQTPATRVGPPGAAARKGKKRRRLRRKKIKPTKFQNVTPHEHLGPSISR